MSSQRLPSAIELPLTGHGRPYGTAATATPLKGWQSGTGVAHKRGEL